MPCIVDASTADLRFVTSFPEDAISEIVHVDVTALGSSIWLYQASTILLYEFNGEDLSNPASGTLKGSAIMTGAPFNFDDVFELRCEGTTIESGCSPANRGRTGRSSA